MNELSMKFFEKMASKTSVSQSDVKLACNTDYSDIDAAFIMKYADKNYSILDLGTGTGLIVNKIYDKVNNIVAVESFEAFSKFIVKSQNITVINENLFDYIPDTKFDMVTAFGTLHYFNEEEAVKIYEKYGEYLKKGGFFVVKNQFGVEEDVNVAGYSKEQATDYWAQYRYIEKEKHLLKHAGYEVVEVCDIYPPECNRWPNTHFYAIVGRKR